jgi:hypothetical protein
MRGSDDGLPSMLPIKDIEEFSLLRLVFESLQAKAKSLMLFSDLFDHSISRVKVEFMSVACYLADESCPASLLCLQ